MQRFEVMFSIYRSNEPGKAAIGNSLTTHLKTIIEAPNLSQAKAIYVNGFLRIDVPLAHQLQTKSTKVPIAEGN